MWPRVAYALGQAYGAWVWRVAARCPGWRRRSMAASRPRRGVRAALAEAAGCSPRTVELIRHQDAPLDPDAGRALQLADEAN